MEKKSTNIEAVVDIVYNQCLILLEGFDTAMAEQEGKITIPNDLCDTVADLIILTDRICPNIESATLDSSSWLKERAVLTPTNESADKINEFMLEKLKQNR
ncbi:hypothetical protein NPIL_668321 [Nephila pilipes]|uniref:ATP-dependent DNA helicase n=1 Tax=Nephila pilipes TaxID=299642 RepID=A0A8X6N9D2_NEPPI|nr:hypothetical protein NPIL_209941 [Nephila pilipes]GFT71393.1 hypothetical protein NPIL_516471 [Nephila pilipes]GFT81293.1 hypothetical protein NPIL_668321 [Nephila pilipes]